MANNEYHFITNWRLKADRNLVVDILGDAVQLPRWWPSVYLEVKQLAPGDEKGIGRRIDLYTKGWLPYTLRWNFEVTESDSPNGFTLVAQGDFVGRGIWTFKQDGEYTDVVYDWKINAEKGLLKTLSFIMKPLFSMNHKWAMKQGEESLKLELMRRQGQTNIAAPPPATPNNPLAWLGYVLTHPTL